MAKQQPAEVELAAPVPVRLDLPASERDRLRLAAARAGVPMSQFARDAVLAAVRRALDEKRGVR
jgi:hypothetical protein